MKRNKIEKELIALYTSSLKPGSRYYEKDLAEFKERLKNKNMAELTQTLINMNAIMGNNKDFNKTVEKELSLMDKSGMFNMNNMKPGNCLD